MDNNKELIHVDLPGLGVAALTRHDAKLYVKNIQRELAKEAPAWKLIQFCDGQPMLPLREVNFKESAVITHLGVFDKEGYGISFTKGFDVRWCKVQGNQILES